MRHPPLVLLPGLCQAESGTSDLMFYDEFGISFLWVPEATWVHLGSAWGQVGPYWLDFGAQVGAELHKVGSKLGLHGPKMRFLQDVVTFPLGLQYRIDFRVNVEPFFLTFLDPRNLENRAPVLALYTFQGY